MTTLNLKLVPFGTYHRFLDISQLVPSTLAMARLARVITPGNPHHLTQRSVRSLPIFRNDEHRKIFLEYMAGETSGLG